MSPCDERSCSAPPSNFDLYHSIMLFPATEQQIDLEPKNSFDIFYTLLMIIISIGRLYVVCLFKIPKPDLSALFSSPKDK